MKARALPAGGQGGGILRPNSTSVVLEVSATCTRTPVSKQGGGAPRGPPVSFRAASSFGPKTSLLEGSVSVVG